MKKTILIFSTDTQWLTFVTQHLKEDYHLLVANTIEEASYLVAREAIDLAILPGNQTVITACWSQKPTRFIVFTGDQTVQGVSGFYHLGAYDVCPWVYEEKTIKNAVAVALRKTFPPKNS